ncbi:MAG: hypothetical protein ACE5JP_18280 [Candidatus Bipolaricaulia bacterium]
MKRRLMVLVLTVMIVGALAGGAQAQFLFGVGGGGSGYILGLQPIRDGLTGLGLGLTAADVAIIPDVPIPHLQVRGQVRLPFIPFFNFLRVDYNWIELPPTEVATLPVEIVPGFPVNVGVNMGFNSQVISATALKQIGLLLFKIYFGVGADMISGAMSLAVTSTTPGVGAAVNTILAGAGLDSNTIEMTTAHALAGGRVGLGFLDLYGELKYLFPLENLGSLTVGEFQVSIGAMLSL